MVILFHIHDEIGADGFKPIFCAYRDIGIGFLCKVLNLPAQNPEELFLFYRL